MDERAVGAHNNGTAAAASSGCPPPCSHVGESRLHHFGALSGRHEGTQRTTATDRGGGALQKHCDSIGKWLWRLFVTRILNLSVVAASCMPTNTSECAAAGGDCFSLLWSAPSCRMCHPSPPVTGRWLRLGREPPSTRLVVWSFPETPPLRPGPAGLSRRYHLPELLCAAAPCSPWSTRHRGCCALAACCRAWCPGSRRWCCAGADVPPMRPLPGGGGQRRV